MDDERRRLTDKDVSPITYESTQELPSDLIMDDEKRPLTDKDVSLITYEGAQKHPSDVSMNDETFLLTDKDVSPITYEGAQKHPSDVSMNDETFPLTDKDVSPITYKGAQKHPSDVSMNDETFPLTDKDVSPITYESTQELPSDLIMDDEKRPLTDKGVSPMTYKSIQKLPSDVISQVQVENHQLHIYKRRWYILIVFCVIAFMQNMNWYTWLPIAQTANDLFGWKNSDIALLTNWGSIAYVFTAVFFAWMIDVKGIRPTCLLAALFLCIGAGLRCITLNQPYVKWLINAGQLFNGLSGPFALAASPVLSSVWFPLHQRFTATAICNMVFNLGASASLFVGTFAVTPSSSRTYNGFDISYSKTNLTLSSKEYLLKKGKEEIRVLLFAEFAICLVIFAMVLVYFPNKPPTPPTISAATPRLEFKEGFKKLMKNFRFWMLGCVYAISNAVRAIWLPVLLINLKSHNISQKTVGMVFLYTGISGCLGAFILGRLADMIITYVRIFIMVLNICSVLGFIWFQLMYTDILKMTLEPLILSVTIPIILLTSTYPLLFELSCELAFPVAEGITTGILNLLSNMVTLLFLGILMIPNISTSWMNWIMLVSVCCIIPNLPLPNKQEKNEYIRFQMDKAVTTQSPNDIIETSFE